MEANVRRSVCGVYVHDRRALTSREQHVGPDPDRLQDARPHVVWTVPIAGGQLAAEREHHLEIAVNDRLDLDHHAAQFVVRLAGLDLSVARGSRSRLRAF
jgi:hypothetical protein